MKSVGELVVHVAELAEAEGRLAKRNIVEVLLLAIIMLGACVLLLSAAMALCAAAFLGLASTMHPAAALAIVALLPLTAGVISASIGVSIFSGKKRMTR
jgi:hypothetical protein